MDKKFIRNNMRAQIGADDNTKMESVIDCDNDESEIQVRHTLVKRFKPSEHEQAEKLYDTLTGSGYIVDLDNIAYARNHGPTKAPEAK